jgi:hypothetical protein
MRRGRLIFKLKQNGQFLTVSVFSVRKTSFLKRIREKVFAAAAAAMEGSEK